MYWCWKGFLEMLLVRIGFCTTKSDIRQWCFACFLSHAQMFKLMKYSFLNSIQIWSGSDFWQRFFLIYKGERIRISLKAVHHWPASEMPLNGVSLACRRWPNVECWLGCLRNFRGSGPILLRNSIFLWFFRGGGGSPDLLPPPFGTAHGTGQCILIEIHVYWKPFFIARIGFYTTLHTFYRMHKFLNWRNILYWIPFGLIWIQTVFANVNSERKRDWYMHIAHPFGKIKEHRHIDK